MMSLWRRFEIKLTLSKVIESKASDFLKDVFILYSSVEPQYAVPIWALTSQRRCDVVLKLNLF